MAPEYADAMDIDEEDQPEPGPPKLLVNLITRAIHDGARLSSSYVLRKRARVKGVLYSTTSTHLGNSLIAFYLAGARVSDDYVVGVIEHILEHDSTTYFVLRTHPPVSDSADPFFKFKDFPARTHYAELSDLEVIEASRVKCHVARFAIPETDKVVIISLSRY
jgi:hypothetical protein